MEQHGTRTARKKNLQESLKERSRLNVVSLSLYCIWTLGSMWLNIFSHIVCVPCAIPRFIMCTYVECVLKVNINLFSIDLQDPLGFNSSKSSQNIQRLTQDKRQN